MVVKTEERGEMIDKLVNWRNKYFESKYELTRGDKVFGWVAFFMLGIAIAIPLGGIRF